MNLTKIPSGYILELPSAILGVIQMALETHIKDTAKMVRQAVLARKPQELIDLLENLRLDAINIQNFIDSCK